MSDTLESSRNTATPQNQMTTTAPTAKPATGESDAITVDDMRQAIWPDRIAHRWVGWCKGDTGPHMDRLMARFIQFLTPDERAEFRRGLPTRQQLDEAIYQDCKWDAKCDEREQKGATE